MSSAFYNRPIPRERFIGCVGIAQHPVFFEFLCERNLGALEARVLHFILSKPKCWCVNPGQLSAAWNLTPETVVDAVKALFRACPELKTEKADWGIKVDAQTLYDLIYERIVNQGEDRWH